MWIQWETKRIREKLEWISARGNLKCSLGVEETPMKYDLINTTCPHNYEVTACTRCERKETRLLYAILGAVVTLGIMLLWCYLILKSHL